MDWKATLEEILAERRQQLGDRPSTDDLVALRAGELTDEDRESLLEHASVDPEVARELFDVLRFPELADDERPDDDGVDERWQAMRDRLVDEGDLPSKVTKFPVPAARWPAAWALAAMFLVGVGTALLFGYLRGPSGRGTTQARINLPIVELLPVGDDVTSVRGGVEVATVGADAGGLVLALAVPDLAPSPEGGTYALELIRGDGTSSTIEGLSPGIGGVFVLVVPREDWADGVHELRLSDGDGHPLARFQLKVELRR